MLCSVVSQRGGCLVPSAASRQEDSFRLKSLTQIHICKRGDSEHVDRASETGKLTLLLCVDEEEEI